MQSSTTVEWDISHLNGELSGFLRMMSLHLKQGKTVQPYIYDRLDRMLTWLDNVQLRPTFSRETQLKQVLGLILNPQHQFPVRYLQAAETLYKKFEDQNWGEPPAIEAPAMPATPPRRATKGPPRASPQHDIKPVPAGHPIWGPSGVMANCAINSKGSRVVHPQWRRPDHRVFGHNGLTVGQFWAYRIALVAAGGHGSPEAGISGSQVDGAYAIVVSGEYGHLDTDMGDVVHYAGSGSHDNENPLAPAGSTSGSKALQVSMSSGNPVRLFRAKKPNSYYGPRVGIRYDGLYKVVSTSLQSNRNGGKYEQFKLIRIRGQDPIKTDVPTLQQRKDYDNVSKGY